MEGSVGAIVVLVLIGVIMVILGIKRGKMEDLWKEMEANEEV